MNSIKNRLPNNENENNNIDGLNYTSISNFKIKKEDFKLDFDENLYDQTFSVTSRKLYNNNVEKENSFNIKSLRNSNNSLNFDYSRPLSPKNHIINIDNNSNNNSPTTKRNFYNFSNNIDQNNNLEINNKPNYSSSPIISNNNNIFITSPTKATISSSSSSISSTLPSHSSKLFKLNFSNDSIDQNLSYEKDDLIPMEVSKRISEECPLTPSPSKLFEKLYVKTPSPKRLSNYNNNINNFESPKKTSTPLSTIKRKQLFPNKRIQDIKSEKNITTKVELPKILKNTSTTTTSVGSTKPITKPSTRIITSTTSNNNNNTTTTTTTTTTTKIISTPIKSNINNKSTVSLTPKSSSLSLSSNINKTPSRKSIATSTINSNKSGSSLSKRDIETSDSTSPKNMSSTMSKALATSTTPSKKIRMSLPSSNISKSTTVTPTPCKKPTSTPKATNLNNNNNIITTATPTAANLIKQSSNLTNKRLSHISVSRKSFVPTSTSTTLNQDDSFEKMIQQAMLDEANGKYIGGSLISQKSPEKTEHSEWSPIRKKSNYHDVHACTKNFK